MPSTLKAPGIYIEELPSGVRPIVGVSTSDTAFVDWFPKGPVGVATRITNFDEFTRVFGGLHAQSAASYAVLQYFVNGGAVAWIVRVGLTADSAASKTLKDGASPALDTLDVTAANPGTWGRSLRVAVTAGQNGVNVVVSEIDANNVISLREIHRNLPTTPNLDALIAAVNSNSRLIRLADNTASSAAPAAAAATATGEPSAASSYVALTGGSDAALFTSSGVTTNTFKGAVTTALGALTRIEPEVFNLLCIPAAADLGTDLKGTVDAAITFCEENRAFLLVDTPPGSDSASAGAVSSWIGGSSGPATSKNAAVYWPRLMVPDPVTGGSRESGPSGTIAGILARTDATRGVWKAPAGIEASLRGATLAKPVNDADSAVLNPIGVNALRTFPVVGNVVWGSRTRFGADIQASEWKYIPVRRTALYIEQS
ncbi:MAG: phage tail sheath subtilisin-like domain-containing protein, partial [Nocardioidaceae bacterium]